MTNFPNVMVLLLLLLLYIFEHWPFVREKTKMQIIGFLSDEGPMFETLDHTIRIGSTPTFLYFDLYICNSFNTRRRNLPGFQSRSAF